MGVNKLKSLIKSMAEKAGLESQRLTNHSVRNKMIKNNADIRAKKHPGHK